VIDGIIAYTGNEGVTQNYNYTFTNIKAYHTITVGFARNCYGLNPANELGDGAVVTMSPANCVQHGQNVTFTIKADCYQYQVKIDSVNMGTFNVGVNDEVFTHTMLVNGPLPLIEVTTTILNYTVTATPAEGVDFMGYIDPAGPTTVNCGSSITYEFHKAIGYRVKTLYIDDVSVPFPPAMTFYTMNNVRANHTIHAEFEEFPYYIIQFGPNPSQNGGRVYPESNPDATNYVAVDSGIAAYKFIIEPDLGYAIDKVIVDGFNIVASVQSGSYTFTHVNANHTIYAMFKPIMFTITATTDGNGSLSPTGAVPVAYGADQMFFAIPNTGYELTAILVDGIKDIDATDLGYYEFTNVLANHTIHATFQKLTYTITSSAGANGTINPEGTITVEYGDSQTYVFTPNTGYNIDQVIVNGVPNAAAAITGSYTFTNISQNNDIHVTFVKKSFTITATYTLGGYIDPAGVIPVEYGAHSPIFVIFEEIGYKVDKVLVDGVLNYFAMDEMMYRFMDVTENHTIHVIFVPCNYTIVATATIGGVITPGGLVSVPRGADKTFFFTPQAGNELIRVVVDGIEVPGAVSDNAYTFPGVLTNHTISAQFEKKLYNVFLPEEVGVIVNPVNGSSSPVEYGNSFMFDVSLAEGYTQSNITVRANNVIMYPVGGIYIIHNITVDQVVTIDGVAPNQYRIVAKAHAGGSITPAGTMIVSYGTDHEFQFYPDNNYNLKEVVVNGENVTVVDNYYLLQNVIADVAIDAYFSYLDISENDGATITVYSVNKVVTIVNESLVPVKTVDIMDMYGRIVWQGVTTEARTDISLNVATGVYGVRIVTESNKITTTKVSIK
jgi:hypothetical protein